MTQKRSRSLRGHGGTGGGKVWRGSNGRGMQIPPWKLIPCPEPAREDGVEMCGAAAGHSCWKWVGRPGDEGSYQVPRTNPHESRKAAAR